MENIELTENELYLIYFLIAITIIFFIILMRDNLINAAKVSYYEQILKNNRTNFLTQKYEHIKRVMRIKTLFELFKVMRDD